jgi:hypothetical protein
MIFPVDHPCKKDFLHGHHTCPPLDLKTDFKIRSICDKQIKRFELPEQMT